MGNKTYEQRLLEVAEEMAKEDRPYSWDNLYEYQKISLINKHKPLAAIALKHMAYWHEIGYTHGAFHEPQIGLQHSLGLIQPQNQ